MLTIGKATVFGRDGLAVPGQYGLESPGWNLRWFSRGREAPLYTGTLPACRRFQAACRGLTDLDAMRKVIDGKMVGETVEMLPLSPMPTEVYPPVSIDAPSIPGEDSDFDGPAGVVAVESASAADDTVDDVDFAFSAPPPSSDDADAEVNSLLGKPAVDRRRSGPRNRRRR